MLQVKKDRAQSCSPRSRLHYFSPQTAMPAGLGKLATWEEPGEPFTKMRERGKFFFPSRTIIISWCTILNLKMSFCSAVQISYVQLECKTEARLTV